MKIEFDDDTAGTTAFFVILIIIGGILVFHGCKENHEETMRRIELRQTTNSIPQ